MPMNKTDLPPTFEEKPLQVIWPSIAAFRSGRWIGRVAQLQWGIGPILTAGNLLAVLSIPLALGLFLWKLLPYVCQRYLITTHRVVVLRGLKPEEERAIAWEQFDQLRVEQLPGQQWFNAGELVFFEQGREVFRLSGVLHPETVLRSCSKAKVALVSTQQVVATECAAETPG